MVLSLDEFAKASRPKRMQCGVAIVLDKLTDKDRKILLGAMANPDVTHSAIEAVLRSERIELSQHTVARHRRGGCNCGS